MSGIGIQLKETREAKGYSLEQVQQSTKIHIEYLRALENDQFDSLPSPFYVRAFLRSYAHCLGLDAQPLMDRYERVAVHGGPPRRQPTLPQGTEQENLNRGVGKRPFRGEPRLGRTYSSRQQRMTSPQGQPIQPFPDPNSHPPARNRRQPISSPETGWRGREETIQPPSAIQGGPPPHQGMGSIPTQPPHQGMGNIPTQPPHQGTGSIPTQPPHQGMGSIPTQPPHQGMGSIPTQPPHQGTGSIPTQPHPGMGSIQSPHSGGNTLQQTQRMQLPIGSQPTAARSGESREQLQQTMTPRKVSQEVKRGVEKGDGKPKKGGASKWMIRVASIGALLLVSIGAYTILNNSESVPSKQSSADKPVAGVPKNDTASAQDVSTPQLSKVKTGNDLEGDLFNLENAKKIEVEIKATKGNTNISVGSKVNNVEESYEIKVGEQRKLNSDQFIWFRLMKPSSTQIKVNGEEIDTTAQDVPKSYRIQLKK
ncbi:Helix-turn-helix domain-containing protein [Kroppenstedtia eburnea]|uniref:Helix-turn-helix domain-containing protein n=2 Tax=Kroppenstedtia eburnea TaxID=714067 RepID=A0A1N7IUE9_9BACL|nr:helix-turn-helix domain-containing protein [Kroppenstedtia eburnea]SIS40694.1 Helix-turn-helix domain-containing protein [Kroppenstedtia eburnea]